MLSEHRGDLGVEFCDAQIDGQWSSKLDNVVPVLGAPRSYRRIVRG